MASVNFMKLHTAQDVKRVLRHCDKECRLQDIHANTDIDKAKTTGNAQSCDYATACKKYDERIAYLDSLPKANKRKDRVTAFSLCVPVPPGISKEQEESYVDSIYNLVEASVGEENVIGGFYHVDEVHKYTDSKTKQDRTSLRHIHMLVMPVTDDKLNGKAFSSKANMIALNKAIDKMTREKYAATFLTGDYDKSTSLKSVEQLKNDSRIAEMQTTLEKDYTLRSSKLEKKELEITRKEREIADKAQEIADRTKELNELSITINRKMHALKVKENELQSKEDELQEKERELQRKAMSIELEVRKRVEARTNLQNGAENAYNAKSKSKAADRELPFP